MMKRHILPGQRFGHLVTVRYIAGGEGNHARWECRCDCGKISTPQQQYLLSGKSTSCGHARGGARPGAGGVAKPEKLPPAKQAVIVVLKNKTGARVNGAFVTRAQFMRAFRELIVEK